MRCKVCNNDTLRVTDTVIRNDDCDTRNVECSVCKTSFRTTAVITAIRVQSKLYEIESEQAAQAVQARRKLYKDEKMKQFNLW